MECLKLGDLLNLKEYLAIFGEVEEEMAKIVKKVELIQMKRDELLET